MRTALLLIVLGLVACSPPPADVPLVTTDAPPAAPQPVALPAYFVESDLELAWAYPTLADNQRFAVRVWADDADVYRELWTQAPSLNAAEMIDSYSQAVGPFHWQVVVVEVNEAGGYEQSLSEWSEVQQLQRVRRLPIDPVPDDDLTELARIVQERTESASERIDFLHQFVVDNANIDGAVLRDSSAYLPDYSDAAQQLVDHANGDGEAPGLFCDGLSTTMLTTLHQLGIEGRLIFLYSDLEGSSYIVQHTMVELFNPDTQRWELHDPTSNTIFVDAQGERADAASVVYGRLQAYQICWLGGDCVPIAAADEATFVEYLEAFRYGYTDTLYANPVRFDVANLFAHYDNERTRNQLPGDPRSFTFRFGLDA